MKTSVRGHVLCACLFFSLSLSLSAQTADGVTPSEEGVCDDLKAYGVTPGLYGLCVAYCEAQDCDSYDGDAPSSCAGLLGNYEERQTDSDPDMPCATATCPCWTAEDLTQGSADGGALALHLCSTGGDWERSIYFANDLSNQVWFSVDLEGCLYRNTVNLPDPSDPGFPTDRSVDGLTVDEEVACRLDVNTLCGNGG